MQLVSFDNSYARLGPAFSVAQAPVPVAMPRLLAWNQALASALGITQASRQERTLVFSGNVVPSGAEPLAQLYAGHQFGHLAPQLGDGRALLIGEVCDRKARRWDIQLKGSGPTPFSRMGDGRACLGPVLREYLVSEAMHALGIPTTRALAAVATGQDVHREQGALPGAILTRVAASHLRVGTFEVFAYRGEVDALQTLVEYATQRHYPEADGPMGLLAAVCAAQVELVAAWMSVGFIHGVMNTDNCTISGETLDYGPCAFMDAYHQARVYSSIDRLGRYSYENQPYIAVWNMAKLATALIPLFDDPDAAVRKASVIVKAMLKQIDAAWLRRFGAKIGLDTPRPEDRVLIEDLLALMQRDEADFTNTFHMLGLGIAQDQFTDQAAFGAWERRWQARLVDEAAPEAVMAAANPVVIPRNHRVEAMIAAALEGDLAPFERLMAALAQPYEKIPVFDDLRRPPSPHERVRATFCGT